MSEPPTPKTIRLYCDGELPDEQAQPVEQQLQQDPRLAARLEFEQRLKEHVGAVMRADGPRAPAGLADTIRQTLAKDEGQPQDSRVGDAGAVVGRIDGGPQPAHGGRAWWRGPNRANLFAVAACLALVVGAVLFGILGPPIDTLRVTGRADAAVEAAAAVAGEHVKITNTLDMVVEGSRFHAPDEARRGLARDLGAPPPIFDISDLGFKFVAGDTCDLPRCERGCHFLYYRSQGKPGIVSLHIVPDRGQFAVAGTAAPDSLPLLTDVIPKGPACQKDVLMWTHGGRSFLLAACQGIDVRAIAKRLQEALVADESAPRS
jgi:anti-sigma factor RsiW